MVVSLSTNAVKLYSPVAGHYYGECKGHEAAINQILFSGPSNPHVLISCSSYGTIRSWDTRTFQQVSTIDAGTYQEVFSFSLGGPNGNLIATRRKSYCSGIGEIRSKLHALKILTSMMSLSWKYT